MEAKKFLKIVGIALLAFFILYIGLMIALGGIGQITGDKVSMQSGSAGIKSFSLGLSAPMAAVDRMASNEMAAEADNTWSSGTAVSQSTATINKKIIKIGNLSLKVEKADSAAEAVANIAKANKGEVASSNFSQSSRGIKSGYIIIRVPYQNFETVFNDIKKIATQVLNESSNAQDITAEYIDLEARLKNKRAEEQSFVALLNRSGKVEEILAVTREIARVRGEIEQLEGQQRYLNSQTDMSTITVNLSEDVEIAPASQDWRPWQVVKASVKRLINAGQNFIDGTIYFIIVILPLLIIYALILWLIYWLGKKAYCRIMKKN